MDKPLPTPLPPHTWTAKHLAALRAAALEAGPAKAETFAADLPYRNAHVEEARHNADAKRIDVRLHGGGIAFHVAVVAESASAEG